MIRIVEVRGYNCLRYIPQPLRRFHILVGTNASGKSTFLDAVLFMRDLAEKDVEQSVRSRARTHRELVWKGEDTALGIALEFKLPEGIPNKRNEHAYGALWYEVRVGTEEN